MIRENLCITPLDLRFIGAMRIEQNSPMDTLLKRPAWEPRNWKKAHRLFGDGENCQVFQRSQ